VTLGSLPPASPALPVALYESEGGIALVRLVLGGAAYCASGAALGFGAGRLMMFLPELDYVWFGVGGAFFALLTWFAIGGIKLRRPSVACCLAALGGLVYAAGFHAGWFHATTETLAAEIIDALPRHILAIKSQQKGQPRIQLSDEDRNRIPPTIRAQLEPVIQADLRAGRYADLDPFQAALARLKRPNLPQALQQQALLAGLPAIHLSPALRETLERCVADFHIFDAVRWRAQRGVTLLLPRIHRPVNLGQTGSYIYWICEALVGMLVLMMPAHRRSARPFCTLCERWKSFEKLGRLNLSGQTVTGIILSGQLLEIEDHHVAQEGGSTELRAALCPACAEESEIVVIVVDVSKDAKGKEQNEELLRATYPGEALTVLRALFQPASAS
jgi:hypothetical protein